MKTKSPNKKVNSMKRRNINFNANETVILNNKFCVLAGTREEVNPTTSQKDKINKFQSMFMV